MNEGYFIRASGMDRFGIFMITNTIIVPASFIILYFLYNSINSRVTYKINYGILVILNIISIVLIIPILFSTLENETGLWKEHISGSGVIGIDADRIHYFFPYVGGAGIYISSVFYYSYKVLAKKYNIVIKENILPILLHGIIVLIPLLVFLTVIFIHNFIEPPYYNG